jgi:hypothetical protein
MLHQGADPAAAHGFHADFGDCHCSCSAVLLLLLMLLLLLLSLGGSAWEKTAPEVTRSHHQAHARLVHPAPSTPPAMAPPAPPASLAPFSPSLDRVYAGRPTVLTRALAYTTIFGSSYYRTRPAARHVLSPAARRVRSHGEWPY